MYLSLSCIYTQHLNIVKIFWSLCVLKYIGTFHHLAANHGNVKGKSFSQSPHGGLARAAENYLAMLSIREPGTIVSGMVRVDLMSYNDSIVVNEFESLEAMYGVPSDRASALVEEFETQEFLKNYWTNMLHSRVLNAEISR